MTEKSATTKIAASAFFSVVLACGLAVSATNAYAAPSDDKQAEADAALVTLSQYQSELSAASANYQALLQDQLDAEAKVSEAQAQIEEKTTEISGYQEKLGQRARDMYRAGATSFLDVILGASTFEQFATTWNMLETLNENDAELVSETKTARQELEAAKTTAEEQAKVASDKAAEAKTVADEASAKAAEMQAVYDNLSAEAAELVAQEQAAAEAAQAAAAQQEIAENAASSSSTSSEGSSDDGGSSYSSSGDSGSGNSGYSDNSGSSNNTSSNTSSNSGSNDSSSSEPSYNASTGNAIVDRAYSKLGCDYSWGGVGPDSFDCSGFVSYCLTGSYSRLGTTYTFLGWQQVSNPQPGDVCVNSGHCGIYIGGGQMIHASTYGVGVIVGPVQSGMIYVRY